MVVLSASGADYGGQKESVAVAISDDDTPALKFSASILNVDEGGSATYTVWLTTEPSVKVSVAITSDNPEVTLDNQALTFGVGDWNQPQRITVSAREDDDASQDKAVLAHEASGGEYESLSGTVAVNVIENDTPALKFSDPTLTIDEGGSATYTVSLATEPSGEVSVAITSDNQEVTLNRKALSFGIGDWNQPQRITVSAREDDDASPEKALLAHTASGGEYESLSGTVAVNVIENDTPALNISDPALTIDEGGSATYTVWLTTEPSVKVSVAITSDNPEVTLDNQALTFGVGDWNQPQRITVSAREDDDASQDKAVLAHEASGGEYESLSGTVAVNVIENDTPALKFSDPTLTIDEGGSATYTVSLATEPSGEVSVAITSDNQEVTLNRKALSFGIGDWNQPQRIAVSAREDDDASPEKALLAHTASGGGYESVTGTVAVNVIENDTPGLTITPPAITVVEGERAIYRVALETEPMSAVTVTIESNNPDVRPAPASLEFSADNWGIEQRVTVNAARDSDVNDATATLTHTASGADYGGVTKDLVVTVRDPDVLAGLVVSPRSLTVTEGTEGQFSVKLLTRPTQAVTVQVSGAEGSGLQVDPKILRFTTEDWDLAVPIVVEAEEDDDGMDARVRLLLTASGAEYTGQEESVVVEIEDDDVAGIVVVPQEFAVHEGGDKSYEVRLSTAPSAEVTVEIASGNPNVGLDREVLTFAINDWDEAKEVTVRAFEDDDAVDDFARLTHMASGGDYEGLTAYVSVEVTDNDEVELRVSPQSLRLVEGGSGKAFDVWLGAVPSGEVRVSVTEASTLRDKVSVSPGSLMFSPSNWTTPQPVMVTALDDEDGSEETGEVRLEASGGGYNGESAEVQIGVTDKDARHRVDLSQEVSVTEGAGPARIEVRLNRESSTEVRVHYTTRSGTATAGGDYAHTSNTLTFAPGGGLMQWIDVPIVDDRVHEEEESFRLVLGNVEGAETRQ